MNEALRERTEETEKNFAQNDQKLQEERKLQADSFAELQMNLEEARDENEALLSQIARVEAERVQLRETLTRMQHDAQRNRENIESSSEEVSNYKTRLDALVTEAEFLRNERTAAVQTLEKIREELHLAEVSRSDNVLRTDEIIRRLTEEKHEISQRLEMNLLELQKTRMPESAGDSPKATIERLQMDLRIERETREKVEHDLQKTTAAARQERSTKLGLTHAIESMSGDMEKTMNTLRTLLREMDRGESRTKA